MTVPVLTFFNNKGGVGKTTLIYHLAWMLSEIGQRVLVCDLDSQANLTAAFLDEERLDAFAPGSARTFANSGIDPGGHGVVRVRRHPFRGMAQGSGLRSMARVSDLDGVSTVIQDGAAAMDATVALANVGPNLGAINRSALISADHVVVPLAADLFSLQGLRNLGPTLQKWRKEWEKRKKAWEDSDIPECRRFPIPSWSMMPLGYVVQQHSIRLDHPVKAYDKWINRIPERYATALLNRKDGPYPAQPDQDDDRLATLKHFRSLAPMAQEARKLIFALRPADGAIGSHATAVTTARQDFHALAQEIMRRIARAS